MNGPNGGIIPPEVRQRLQEMLAQRFPEMSGFMSNMQDRFGGLSSNSPQGGIPQGAPLTMGSEAPQGLGQPTGISTPTSSGLGGMRNALGSHSPFLSKLMSGRQRTY